MKDLKGSVLSSLRRSDAMFVHFERIRGAISVMLPLMCFGHFKPRNVQ
jgi:hypothetical protein